MEEWWTGTRKLTKTTTAATTATINSYSINEAFNLLAQPLFRYHWTKTTYTCRYMLHFPWPIFTFTIHNNSSFNVLFHIHAYIYTQRHKYEVLHFVHGPQVDNINPLVMTSTAKKYYTFSFYSSTCWVY